MSNINEIKYIHGGKFKESAAFEKAIKDFLNIDTVKELKLVNVSLGDLSEVLDFEIIDTNGWQGDFWIKDGDNWHGSGSMYYGYIHLTKGPQED